MALDTLAGVRGEMARLYRLALNGRIRSDEMTRFIYALKEIRACLEAEILTDVQQRMALLSREMDNHNGSTRPSSADFPEQFEYADRLPAQVRWATHERRSPFEEQPRWRIIGGDLRKASGGAGKVARAPAGEALRIDSGTRFLAGGLLSGGCKWFENLNRPATTLDADRVEFAPE